MLVVDASVLVVALADDGPDGDRVRERLRAEALAAPELVDLEIVSVLRRQLAVGALDARRSELALPRVAPGDVGVGESPRLPGTRRRRTMVTSAAGPGVAPGG